jgi:hypothetical protein
MLKKTLYFFLFIFLTILTQVGGVVLLLSLFIDKKIKKEFRFKSGIIFFILYLLSTFIIVPLLAPIFGREKIKHTENIQPTMFLTGILNRNYVRPELNNVLANCEKNLKGTGIKIKYLDANFPFINKFPLLPHLSHNDGKKLDISLVYNDNEKLTNDKKSNSGYGVFAVPKSNETNQIAICKQQGYFQYDYPKYMTLGSKNSHLEYSNEYTKKLILAILKNKSIEKIFIEPHLKNRLKIKDNRMRYHGCRAVRHDDHIHIQIR